MQKVRLKIASRQLVFMVDVFIGQMAYLFSCLLYFSIVAEQHLPWFKVLAGSLVMGLLTLLGWRIFRVTSRIVRFSNQAEYLRLLFASLAVHLMAWGLSIMFIENIYGAFQLWIISFLFHSMGLISMRIMIRYLLALIPQLFPAAHRTRLLIYGSGVLGQSLKKALEADAQGKYELLGFLDDDPSRIGKYIDGVNVYPAGDHLRDTVISLGVEEVIIAIKKLNPGRKARFIEELIVFDLKIKELPPLNKWYAGAFSPDKLASININDLLNRDPILLHNDEVKAICQEHTILVTGAAGSIGSEIVRKLAENGAQKVVCLDQAETPLHDLQLEMREKHPDVDYRFIVADITDTRRIEQVLQQYQPNYLFHAAAYKHVPLMEDNPYEAIFTNVEGTRRLADTAVANGVARFVMISSDKAVNPTNVMGATKRLAEVYVQALNKQQQGTRFITTRFGNVLGSNGSVIPLFKHQIAKGGPVTVTHPDMVRYFMTIPEACQLVLEAAAMGKGGEVFVFEMGKPVRITDLARSMIRLSGYIPDKDIKIEYTGMRPGEKLFEELFTEKDYLEETHHPKIMIGKVKQYAYEHINQSIDGLIAASYASGGKIREAIRSIIPEYNYQGMKSDHLAMSRTSLSKTNV